MLRVPLKTSSLDGLICAAKTNFPIPHCNYNSGGQVAAVIRCTWRVLWIALQLGRLGSAWYWAWVSSSTVCSTFTRYEIGAARLPTLGGSKEAVRSRQLCSLAPEQIASRQGNSSREGLLAVTRMLRASLCSSFFQQPTREDPSNRAAQS